MRFVAVVLIALSACHPAVTSTAPRVNLGTMHRPIRTTSAEAQAFFDRGLAALYGFNYFEAVAQFDMALRSDMSCAMCNWGYAMALAANINGPDNQAPTAGQLAERAEQLARDPVERALAGALRKRFAPMHMLMMGPLPEAERNKLNHDYMLAMRDVAKQFPTDDEVQVAYADALLVDTPRMTNNWTPEGAPATPNVAEAKVVLERVLARSPNHLGAIHFYIHDVDLGPHMALALPYALRLATLAPDAGHLIHMPSHLLVGLGRYAEAEDANLTAIAADKRYLANSPPAFEYEMFSMHPKDYLWSVLIIEGKRADAERLSKELGAMHMMGPFGPTNASYEPLTYARFGNWDAALALPEGEGITGAVSVGYAKGLALAAKGKLDDATAQAGKIRAAAAPKPDEPAPPPGMGPPPAVMERMKKLLAGISETAALQIESAVADARGEHDKAIEFAEKAVAAENGLPPEGETSWFPLPARQRLGKLLLAANRPADAERVYREDLAKHLNNGWSLFGLATALEAQRKPEANAMWEKFRAAWKRSDVKLSASIY